MEDDFINSAIDMMTPVMEGSMILAAQYAKACNRTTVTAMDMKYGMRYAAKNFAGKQIGTLFPELQGSDEEEDDASSVEEVDEDEEPFTIYKGDDEVMIGMNKAYDEWDEWEPFSPLEKMLKSAIDKSG